MPKSFKTAVAFRQALEQRLKTTAAIRGAPLNTLRLKLIIARLLTRLFAEPQPEVRGADDATFSASGPDAHRLHWLTPGAGELSAVADTAGHSLARTWSTTLRRRSKPTSSM
jgi:hypothetical protein